MTTATRIFLKAAIRSLRGLLTAFEQWVDATPER